MRPAYPTIAQPPAMSGRCSRSKERAEHSALGHGFSNSAGVDGCLMLIQAVVKSSIKDSTKAPQRLPRA
jgi:hypothetical protein